MVERHLDEHSEEELISLARELIRIPSTVTDGGEIYEFVHSYLRDRGLPAEFQNMRNPYLEYQDFQNVSVRLGSGNGPRIHLNCHLDTVAAGQGWYHPPLGAVEEKERLYGLGAADMKGGCAAAIHALIVLSRQRTDINGELFLGCVFGEEAPFSLGTDTLLREYGMKDFDLMIVPEPSPLLAVKDYCTVHGRLHRKPPFPVVIVGAEGRVLFEIEFFGVSAHASHPSQGVNALHSAARFISKLTDFDLYSNIKMGRGHYVVLNIEGGNESFTIPDRCKIQVNRQLTIGENEKMVFREIKTIIRSLKLSSRVRISKRFSPDPCLEYHPYLFEGSEMIDIFMKRLPERKRGKRCRLTTSSVGDFNLLAERTGVATIVFGPGGGNIHAANEYVNRQEIIDTAEYLLDFMLEVF